MIEAATVSTPMGFTNNSKILSGQYVPEKKLRGNFSISLQRYWTSNQIQLYAGYVLLNQSARQSEQAVCCVPIYQNDASIPKSTNVLKKLFTNGLYTIFRLCSLQQIMIISNDLYMDKQEHSQFQIFNCEYQSENYIIVWRVQLKKGD